jgi:C4-dicarboxylate-specific signal transduction histidine kinase
MKYFIKNRYLILGLSLIPYLAYSIGYVMELNWPIFDTKYDTISGAGYVVFFYIPIFISAGLFGFKTALTVIIMLTATGFLGPGGGIEQDFILQNTVMGLFGAGFIWLINRERRLKSKLQLNSYKLEQRTRELNTELEKRGRIEADLRSQKDLIDRILSNTPDAVLVIGGDLRVKLANQAFQSMFDQNENQVEGKRLEEVVHKDELVQLVTANLDGKAIGQKLEFKYKVNISEKYFLTDVIPMQRGEALVIFQDVTEERTRQEKSYLNDRLASIGEMAAGIAHELNNPLTSITMLSQILVKNDMPQEDKEDLLSISNEAKRAAAVVKNLLTFARKYKSEKKPEQINRVLEDVLKLRSYEHRVNNIRIDARLDAGLPEVEIDYFQMQQVFLNLVLNAEQAMFEAHRQGLLSIITQRVNNHVRAIVKDNGPGITKENLHKLFSPFFTTKEVGKGTGLGLSISYGIVSNHGGRIYAESEPGRGATFIVELPVKGFDKENSSNNMLITEIRSN